MRGKKLLACVTACAMMTSASVAGTMGAVAADGLGGFTWSATEGYQEGTTGVENGADSVTVSFADTDNGTKNAAGFYHNFDGADWSGYDTLSFTLTNNSASDINFAAAVNTGASWKWHQSDNITVSAGATKDVTLYLKAEEWWYYDSDTQTNSLVTIADLFNVQRVNMMIMSTSETATVSGSVTLSGWKLEQSGSGEVVEPKDGFYVDGTVLRDANQNAFEMRGTNYAYTWYKWEGNEEATLKEIAAYGANTVRIVLSDGQQYTKNTAGEVANLISLCEKYKLVAVLEVHDVTGKDDANLLLNSAKYFAEIKSALIGHEDTVIINIANEWQGNANTSSWESAYIAAVKAIRDAGLTHCIMCDAGGWGQGYVTVRDGGSAVLASDPERNVMFSVHMYGTAGGSSTVIKSVIDGIMTRNLCLVIGEFGYKHSDGEVDEAYIMEYCKEVQIGWLAWSWYGNGSPVEYLDMSSANVGGTLSADWGAVVVNGKNGWKETSKVCSVYTDAPVTTTTEVVTTTTTEETTTTTETETTTTTEAETTSVEVTTTTTTTTTVAETTTEAGETTTTTTQTVVATLYGDVDCNGTVEISDIVLLARYIAQDQDIPAISPEGLANANCVQDNNIDADDLTQMARYLAHLISENELVVYPTNA